MRPSRRQTAPLAREWSSNRPSATILLVGLSLGTFCAQLMVELFLGAHGGKTLFLRWFALDGVGIASGEYWRFLTFPLVQYNPVYLLGSLLVLYLAGREVESIMGGRHLLGIYLGGLFVGGFTQWLVMPEWRFMGTATGVGAVLVAFASILPELEVKGNLFAVFPVKLRLKYLAWGVVGLSVIGWLWEKALILGPAGMMVASVFGWTYVQQLGFGNSLSIQRMIFAKRQKAARLDRMSAEQFMVAEIDPILEKISREGMGSLSRAERKLLEMGGEKIKGSGR
jgi:membrane associated rhomboid family serine protease